MRYRVAHISDPHLSLKRPFFQHNWEIMVEMLNTDPPDLIVCTGDISIDGADRESELVYAAEQMKRLKSELLIAPGNHDCGNSCPDGRGGETLVTPLRLANFRKHVGPDFWVRDLEQWRLIGINSMLPGSGLPDDEEQWLQLEEALASAGRRKVIVFMHKPLFLDKPSERKATQSSMYPEHRKRLGRLLQDHGVFMLATGHIHDFRRQTMGKLKLLWAPSTAFVIDSFGLVRSRYGVRRVGYLEYRFDGRRLSTEFVEPHQLINYDLGNWMRNPEGFHARYGSEPLRTFRQAANS
jgi:3',5'-cyclic AMP phosphodiesterase CpdA